MKKFVVVLVLAAAVFFLQRRGARDPAPDAKTPAALTAAATATPRPIYQHDWAKYSLDRAQTVVDQVKKSREENQQP